MLINLSVARQDLVSWLQEKIFEQKRVDAHTSGAERFFVEHGAPISVSSGKDNSSVRDVQLILPGDLKKGRGGPKQIFADRGKNYVFCDSRDLCMCPKHLPYLRR
jgi:hypothetical protein